jgi:DNA-binding NarL/FixJ family response regulator
MGEINVALVDDHVLLRNGLAILLGKLGFNVLFECSNGKEMQEMLARHDQPDIILMDINMPEMDGYDATVWLGQEYPLIPVLTLSMYDDENAIIRMLKSGARGYVMKESEPMELKRAIEDVISKGVHYSEIVTGKLLHSVYHVDHPGNVNRQLPDLTKNEIEFLKLASTEMTYKEIADAMNLSPRTIDGYRDTLFDKLNIRNRVGLVLYAIRQNIVRVN